MNMKLDYSKNASERFTEEKLNHYMQEVQELIDMGWDYEDELEPLSEVWMEDPDMIGEGEYAVIQGDYIIADGLTELQSEVLYDEIMAYLEGNLNSN